jgi:hypothetical protein
MSESASPSFYSNEFPDMHDDSIDTASPDQVSELTELSDAIQLYATNPSELRANRRFMVTADPSDIYTEIAPAWATAGYHNYTNRIGYDMEGNTTIQWRYLGQGKTPSTRNRVVRHITMLTLGDSPFGMSRPTERFFEEAGHTEDRINFVPDTILETPAHSKEPHDLSVGVTRSILAYLRQVVADLPAEIRVAVPLRNEYSQLVAIDPLAPNVVSGPAFSSVSVPVIPGLRDAVPGKLKTPSEQATPTEQAPDPASDTVRDRARRFIGNILRRKPREA